MRIQDLLYRTIGRNIIILIGLFLYWKASLANSGLEWLIQQVQQDGSYSHLTDPATPSQSTSETLRTFRFLNAPAPLAGQQFLDNESFQNTESLSRQIIADSQAGQTVTSQVNELLSRQNADGGFGDFPEYQSTILDTSFALEALVYARQRRSTQAQWGVNFLLAQQHSDGSWGNESEASFIYLTALITNVLQNYAARETINQAINFLATQVDTQGALEEDFEVALTLLATISERTRFQKSFDYLQARQQQDGSWGEEVYTTALALRALHHPDDSSSSPYPQASLSLIQGIVVDAKTHEGLPHIHIRVKIEETEKDFQSAPDGHFSLEALNGKKAELTFTGERYATIHFTVPLPLYIPSP